MKKRRRIEGLTGKRLIIAVLAIFLLTVVSRQNAFAGGIIVALFLGTFAFLKYRHSDYVPHFDTSQELCDEFFGDRGAFAHFVSNVFAARGYIVENAPDGIKTSVDIKLWSEGREYLVTVVTTEVPDEMICEEQVRALHIDMVECDSDGGFLVTCGCYDEQMAEQARRYDITLIDGKTLLSYTGK